jgi:hypothetical protein
MKTLEEWTYSSTSALDGDEIDQLHVPRALPPWKLPTVFIL